MNLVPLSVPELTEAVNHISPSVVIAPDKLKDATFTLDAFFETHAALQRKTGIAIVLSGVSPAERADMVMRTREKASMLCLPFREPRLDWFEDLTLKIPQYIAWPARLHLLGVSTLIELRNFRLAFDNLNVPSRRTSVDSSKPIKLGIAGIRIDETTDLRGKGTLDSFEKKADATHIRNVLYNIAYLRRWL
jgi:hypothetical protein